MGNEPIARQMKVSRMHTSFYLVANMGVCQLVGKLFNLEISYEK